MKSFLPCLLFMLVVSCRPIEHHKTIIEIYIKSNENDKIQLFYLEKNQEKYDKDRLVVKGIKGMDDFQKVVFDIPKNILLKAFRIDLGERGYETVIDLKTIKLIYGDKIITIDQDTFKYYFKPNIYIEKGESNDFKRKKIKNKYDPFIESTAFLEKKMYLEFR